MPGLLLLLLSIPVTPQEAIRGFLRPDHGQQIAGLIRLETACAGARRHDFRDDPRLLKADCVGRYGPTTKRLGKMF